MSPAFSASPENRRHAPRRRRAAAALCAVVVLLSGSVLRSEEYPPKKSGQGLFSRFKAGGLFKPEKTGKARSGATLPTGSACTADEAHALVGFHDQVRAEAGTGPLSWSSEIAAFAQSRADEIAKSRRLAHLPPGRNPYGENLALGGGGGGFGVLDACKGWHAEKAKMPAGAKVLTSALFRSGVGHYTQMVWGETTRIGCGVVRYEEDGQTMVVVVCCYDPPGNRIGGSIYEVPR